MLDRGAPVDTNNQSAATWRAYLKFDGTSQWAAYARKRLAVS